jgi:hypothetical protein
LHGRDVIKTSHERRRRAVSLALLFLLAHAVFVNLTHHHNLVGAPSSTPDASVTATHPGGPDSAPDSGSDRHCQSCCLQRHFAIHVRPIPIPPDLRPEPVRAEVFIFQPGSTGVFLVLSSRAPPLG